MQIRRTLFDFQKIAVQIVNAHFRSKRLDRTGSDILSGNLQFIRIGIPIRIKFYVVYALAFFGFSVAEHILSPYP